MLNSANNHNKLLPVMVILIIICIVLTIFMFSKCGDSQSAPSISDDQSAVTWNGEQHISRPTVDNKPAIAIPGIKEMIFVANQREQKVNLYNPENNACYFQMNLYANQELIWKSGNVAPGNGFYNIKLNKSLSMGTKQGYLLVRCFKQNGAELNSARIKFDIVVE